jgi:hypothetical protein
MGRRLVPVLAALAALVSGCGAGERGSLEVTSEGAAPVSTTGVTAPAAAAGRPAEGQIAYVCGDGVCIERMDDGSVRRLARGYAPELSADGRTLTVVDGADVVVVDVATGRELERDAGAGASGPPYGHASAGTVSVPLPPPPAAPPNLEWGVGPASADGTRVLLVAGCVHGCTQSVVFDTRTRTTTPIPGTAFAISADGTRVLAQDECDTGASLDAFPAHVIDVASGDALLTLDTPTHCGVSWSPLPPEPAVAPVEDQVAFVRDGAVWVAPGGGEPRRIVAGSWPVLSPDGRLVAVQAPGDEPELAVVDVASGRVLVRRPGVYGWTWSPDASTLVAADGMRLRRIDVHGGEERGAGTIGMDFPGRTVEGIGWSPDGTWLVVGASGPDVSAVVAFDPSRAGWTVDRSSSNAAWGAPGIAYARQGSLVLRDRLGGTARELPLPAVATEHHRAWVPVAWGGRRLLLAHHVGHGATEAAVLDVDSGAFVDLGPGNPQAISRDGTRVLVQDDRDCTSGAPHAVGYVLQAPLTILAADGSGELGRIGDVNACGASWSPTPPP